MIVCRALAAILVLTAVAAGADPAAWRAEWPRTDFARATVDLSEVRSGGPPRDGIPAIDDPRFVAVAEKTGLAPREPVMTLEIDGAQPRAYPVRYLMWHEIVNDRVAGVPVAVTFCPLCNSGMVFDRQVAEQVLTFGVTGKLRHSDMIMFDRETESWWQQAVGRGIAGAHAGTELRALPARMESWDAFRARHPGGLVMAEPDLRRAYGQNPYRRYDSADRPFLYDGAMPPHGIHPLARVVRVGDRAWPLDRLRAEGEIVEAGVRLTWGAGQASALDTARIADGREVGNVRVRDAESGRDLVHDIPFAFAFHAFWPDGAWMR